MGIVLEYPAGATPLDPDEAAALIPSHVVTQGQLNEWELENILEGRRWAVSPRRLARADLLTADFMRKLHKQMFDKTWKWAGTFRKTEKNIGVAPEQIAVRLRDLCDDTRALIEHRSLPLDEIVARFHHRLVAIHPFPNGNGRHSRLMADLILIKLGAEPFSWGADNLAAESTVRMRYLEALRMADKKDYAALFAFVRSGASLASKT